MCDFAAARQGHPPACRATRNVFASPSSRVRCGVQERPVRSLATLGTSKPRKHQAAWAKHLGVPVENDQLHRHEAGAHPARRVQMGSSQELIRGGVEDHPGRQVVHGTPSRRGATAPGPDHQAVLPGAVRVTQEEYQRVMGHNPGELLGNRQQQGQGSRTGHKAISRGNGVLAGRR